jgi:hypothetical protein
MKWRSPIVMMLLMAISASTTCAMSDENLRREQQFYESLRIRAENLAIFSRLTEGEPVVSVKPITYFSQEVDKDGWTRIAKIETGARGVITELTTVNGEPRIGVQFGGYPEVARLYAGQVDSIRTDPTGQRLADCRGEDQDQGRAELPAGILAREHRELRATHKLRPEHVHSHYRTRDEQERALYGLH